MRELIERVHARKNAPPASLAELRASEEVLSEELAKDEWNIAELAGNEALLDAPETIEYANAQALLPVKRRRLTALREEIARAAKREEQAELAARLKCFERDTAKAAKTFSGRYTAAAEAFAAVLRELADSKDKATAIAAEGHRLGVPSSTPHLEVKVRDEEIQRGCAWLQDQFVRDIHGRVIFQ